MRTLLVLVALILIVRGLLALRARARARGVSVEEPPEGGFAPGREVREMVQDPECGVFIARHGALTTVAEGHVHYFCSPPCYRAFLTRVAAERNSA